MHIVGCGPKQNKWL